MGVDERKEEEERNVLTLSLSDIKVRQMLGAQQHKFSHSFLEKGLLTALPTGGHPSLSCIISVLGNSFRVMKECLALESYFS